MLHQEVELNSGTVELMTLIAAATVMVGDREHDIRAARQNGLRSIGVTYGYGSVEELQAAGADVLCEHVAGVAAAINDINSTVANSGSTSGHSTAFPGYVFPGENKNAKRQQSIDAPIRHG